MPLKRIVRILEVWKKETVISEILKEQKGRELEQVTLEDDRLVLSFSNTKGHSIKTVVKQYSKRKHNDINICISEFLRSKSHQNGCSDWHIISIIELPDIWIIFFERNI